MKTENLEFKLTPNLYNGKIIAIKLNFKDPSIISSSSVPDILEVKVRESVVANFQNKSIVLPRNVYDSSQIPPQLTYFL